MKIAFAKPEQPTTGTYIVGVLDDRKLTPAAAALDKKTGGLVTRAMGSSRFKGRKDDLLDIVAPKGVPVARVVLVGLGKAEQVDALRLQALGGTIVAYLNRIGESAAALPVENLAGAPLEAPEMAANIAYGARLRAYRFDKYRTREKEEQKPSLKGLNLLVTDVAEARKAFASYDRIADAIYVTRDLVSEPPNVIYPETLADRCKRLSASASRSRCSTKSRWRSSAWARCSASARAASARRASWSCNGTARPKAKDKRPIAFFGKGVTFDTGGISIKPAAGMEDMKWDMGGAGAVIGLMEALAGRKRQGQRRRHRRPGREHAGRQRAASGRRRHARCRARRSR